MRRNPFSTWPIIVILLIQQSAVARVATASPERNVNESSPSVLPEAGSVYEVSGHATKIVRVTDGQDGSSASTSALNGSSFNADSTLFFVNLDGIVTLYSFDGSRLGIQKQERLFDPGMIDAKSAQWSASDPGMIIGLETNTARLQSFDIHARTLSLIKDFTAVLPEGEAQALSKSWNDDNRFAFAWRESGASSWRYVVVWDRLSDTTYLFDISDPVSGVAGFKGARLDKSGDALIVNGDVDRVWRYGSQPQSESIALDPEIQDTGVELASRSTLQANDSYDLARSIRLSSNDVKSLPRFPRDDVSRDGRFAIFNSNLDGSRTDVFIATLGAQAATTSSIMWTNMVNCTASDNTLQKTSGSDETDDARATSLQSIASGDAHVEFTASETGKERFCGLNNSNDIHQSAGDINFAIRLSGNKAMVSENGKTKAKTKYKAGNLFRIAIESGVVNYYKNGSVFYTSSARPVYPLLVNASLINTMSSVSNVMAFGAAFGTVISISPGKTELGPGETVQFTALVTGLNDEPINWSATGGTISGAGQYSPPTQAGTYTVKAVAARDSSISASASVLVKGGADNKPPIITEVAGSAITSSAATITWTTNEPSDTQVEYGTTTAYGGSSTLNPAMVLSHSISLGGLAPATLYHYRVKSKDAAGNRATSGDFTFTTLSTGGGGGDTTPPAISAVSSSGVTTGGATVTWSTDEASDTQVEYGTTTSYGSSTARNTAMVTGHTATLSALSAGTLYHYRVKSRDAAGNTATSGDSSFMTASTPPPPPPPGGDGGVITDYGVYAEPPPPALPAAGGTFVDPVFGTTIMRVTDQSDGAFNATNYSYWPSFNKDSTRLYIIAGGQASLYSFDPVNFRISNKRRLFLSNPPTGNVPNAEDAIWSGIDPNVIFGHDGLKIWAYNVATNSYSLVKDFAGELPPSNIAQMSRSIDDNVFAFSLKNSSGGDIGYVAWRRNNNSTFRINTTNLDEVQVDKTGQYLVVKQSQEQALGIEVRVINLLTQSIQELTDGSPDYAPGHSDNGAGFVIGGDNWQNRFTYRNLSTPHQMMSIIEFGQDWSVGSHVSMLGDSDQWMLISTFVANDLPSSRLFRNELFEVATDGSKRVRRLAHTHSVYREYWDSPRATMSRDGRFAVFTSNWGATDRRDVFICKIPPVGGAGGGGGDTTPPVIGSVTSSNVSASGASISWATSEASNSQVEYGTTASYGNSTALNSSMVTSHTVALSGLAASTTYHYRVRSGDAAGNQAVSGDLTFTTAASGGGGGGTGPRQNVVWTGAVNCQVSGNSLQKNGGFEDTPDAGARSQQVITSGDGYVEFTATETNRTRFCGLTRNAAGTDYATIDFAIKVTDIGIAEVRENNVYQRETTYRTGDVFRVAIESGAIKYYKNGAMFYTSARTPSYPMIVDAALINMTSSVTNAVIGVTGTGTLASDFSRDGFRTSNDFDSLVAAFYGGLIIRPLADRPRRFQLI